MITGFFMLLTHQIDTPGEHLFFFSGQVGRMEAILTVPDNGDKRYIALLGHPHSLQGGTMNNKVVTTLARAFKELNIASIRFNFRGVGQSAGAYDEGIGESEDMLLLAHLWLKEMPDARILFAGFSFGSYVAYRAAAQCRHSLLITVAPPVHHYNFSEFSPAPTPWIIAHGQDDEVVPLPYVLEYASNTSPTIPVRQFAETGHFFHGKLIDLKQFIIEIVCANVVLR